MSFFAKLFGRKPQKVTTPEELREVLFGAAAEDRGSLEDLCRTHHEAILTAFATWTKVPPEVRADPAAVQRYANGLISVARTFAERLGDPTLFQRLAGPPKENPLAVWQEQLGRARQLMDALRYPEATELLTSALTTTQGMTGSGVDEYLPITLGLLGECHFHGGDAACALEPFREALRLCEEQEDSAGIVAYLGNLYEVCRYLGDAAGAAELADRIASAFASDPTQARVWRKRAQIVRTGPPKCRAVVVVNEQHYELDELPRTANGRLQIVFERDRISLRPAVELTDRGTTGEGQRHLLEQAIALNGNLVAAAMARAILRMSIEQEN